MYRDIIIVIIIIINHIRNVCEPHWVSISVSMHFFSICKMIIQSCLNA